MWKELQENLSTHLKISSIVGVLHKSRSCCTILDLLFQLKVFRKIFLSVNKTMVKISPPEALGQIGEVLPCLIEAVVMATKEDGDILSGKLNIKN